MMLVEKISEAGRGRIFSETRRKNISESLKGNKNGVGSHRTTEAKAKISVATSKPRPSIRGENHWSANLGDRPDPRKGQKLGPMSEETKDRLSKSLTGKKYSGRNGKSVICLTDGREFKQAKQAAETYGLSKSSIGRACASGLEIRGFKFAWKQSS